MRRYQSTLLSILIIFVLGCATVCPPQVPDFIDRPRECHEFIKRFDEKVRDAGVSDAPTFPVPGFPYLRTNRFLSALKDNLNDYEQMKQWVRWMHELDLRARKREIQNLPDEVILSLKPREDGHPNREGLYRRLELCSHRLLDHDLKSCDFYETLAPFVYVPDEYSLFMRAIGLYPLASIPVILATRNVREEFRSVFKADLGDLPIEGKLVTFLPADEIFLTENEIQKIIADSSKNPLGVPWLDSNDERLLAASFAPIFIQDVAGTFDRFGQFVWIDDCPEIETEKPTVYYYTSHAFMKGEPIIQINYAIWYSERAGRKSPWIERGPLDGLTVRVSLDKRGEPFMVDIMNSCGCYHLFAPKEEKVDQILNKRFRLDPFVPQWLPTISPGERLGIRVNSGWHQVERLIPTRPPEETIPYDLLPYEVLETLIRRDGRRESIFNRQGIVKCSKRIEPFIFFSMGINSIGFMRQRGNHPIQLTGRLHFDDPHIFDRSFVFK